ncbi:transposase [Nonomuraea jabiensis]|uniref:Transposase n=1 Tax=Nonomuraea jabiensis TaxID=882448 RepID=A0A7W9LEP3_9ACTN|nr:transposase [Nonomuraea jabiensis]
MPPAGRRDLIVATHRHLGAPLVIVWLPAYAPELNPVEGV